MPWDKQHEKKTVVFLAKAALLVEDSNAIIRVFL